MAKTTKTQKTEDKKQMPSGECSDPKCPFHGELSVRGRVFRGTVIRKFSKRITIEFERTLYIRKFERYAKSKTKLHAWLPECFVNQINVGDYIEIQECRKLSKIVSFVVMKKIRGKNEKANIEASDFASEENKRNSERGREDKK